jgi:hypothetical protein
MKQFILLTMVLLGTAIATHSSAQTFCVKAGLNLSTFNVPDENTPPKPLMTPGLHMGITRDFKLSQSFVFETGILFSMKGYRVDYSGTFMGIPFTIDGKTNLSYLEIPLLIKGYYEIGPSTRLYAAAGPYVGIGLVGKEEAEVTINGDTESDFRNLSFGEDEDVKRVDLGLNFGTGIEFKSFLLGVNYGLGLTDISQNSNTIKNRVLAFSLGYRFGG